MRKPLLAALALCLAMLCAAAQAQEDIDFKQGKLGRLSPNIGTYHYDAVLNDPDVAADLRRRLGPKGVEALKARLVVQNPIEFDGSSLVLQGIMAHAGTFDEAILSVRPHDGEIEVAMLIGGRQVLASIDHFFPQAPADAVQRQAVQWAQKAGTRVHLVEPGGR